MPTKLEHQIIKRVISARMAAGLSRRDVADALGLGEASYGHYERGRYAFTVEQVMILSRVLMRSVPWLLGLEAPHDATEDELLTCYRRTTDSGRNAILSVARSMAREQPRS
ncbi:MAG: helix-turn-helix transcriptional regulator [Chloroflexi bacterium]|nr:helix-turn-helix transcriptional regulator [Chloroflexota bacterium]